jgi:FkbM family methyltransferase
VSNFKDIYNNWRRSSLFPSINEIDWRHKEVVARLNQIHQHQIKDQFNPISPSIELNKQLISFFSCLQPMKINGHAKTRVGNAGDGGYVQLEDLDGINLALSFGISDDDSWDVQIANRNINVMQFDYTVDAAPTNHPLMSFYKKKVSGTSSDGCVTLHELIESHNTTQGPNIILKMDIEGSEWDVFNKCPDEQLSKIRQIVCEFHGFSRLNEHGFYSIAYNVVSKLNKYFIPYHVHGNNAGQFINMSNIAFPDVLEVSYANRQIYSATATDEIFPTPLDQPNIPELPDIFLGSFQFSRS